MRRSPGRGGNLPGPDQGETRSMDDTNGIPPGRSADDADVVAGHLQAITDTYGGDRCRETGICVADGMGVSLRVDCGHLVVTDGLGAHRRERRFHKATHGLSRLVILGASGTLSLDALRYCDRLGIAVAVIDPGEPRASFLSTPRGTDDARLRRVQAVAPDTDLGMDICRMLLAGKLDGQAALLRDVLGAEAAAQSVETIREDLLTSTSVDDARQLEATAAACYFGAWVGSPRAVPSFATREQSRVPAHWVRFDGRRSVLTSGNGNRKAERPINAVLNYLFGLVEIEAITACHLVGLDPGLGIVHLDTRSRQSMALDLMEPVRPAVEQWTLELLARRRFRRADFTETADGHVRVLSPLTHDLAETMPRWRQLLAPWAERVVHIIGRAASGDYHEVTPLTGTKHRSAQARVRSRKAKSEVFREVARRADDQAPRQKPGGGGRRSLATCTTCGGPLSRDRHRRCPTCWEHQPGQDQRTRRRRGAAIAETRAELERWKTEHPGAQADPDMFRTEILPRLARVKLAEIMDVCGVAKSTASMIRSGKHVPALRHWDQLANLHQR